MNTTGYSGRDEDPFPERLCSRAYIRRRRVAVGVTEAACTLQQRGLIDYSRGNIRILDHAGLERAACSRYKRVRGRDHARAG